MDPFSNEWPLAQRAEIHTYSAAAGQGKFKVYFSCKSTHSFVFLADILSGPLLIKAKVVQCRLLTSQTMAQKYKDFGRIKSRVQSAKLCRRQASCSVVSVPHISRDINEFLEMMGTSQWWRSKATLGLCVGVY